MQTEMVPDVNVRKDEKGSPFIVITVKTNDEITEVKVPLYKSSVTTLSDDWTCFIADGGDFDGYMGLYHPRVMK